MKVKVNSDQTRTITFYQGNEYPVIDYGDSDYGFILIETMNGVRAWIHKDHVQPVNDEKWPTWFSTDA